MEYCNDFLKVGEFKDYCVNGMQVEGNPKVSRVVMGVSISAAFIKAALKKRAQMLIVHHGFFGEIGNPPQIQGVVRERLKLLLQNNLTLCGYHLPLDAHPKIGNNVSLCELFELENLSPCEVGFVGELPAPTPRQAFVESVNYKLGVKSFVIAAGPAKVRRVGIISGGASPEFAIAASMGADTYICGDVRENVVRMVEESGINFINAGHYNTEKLGIKNLGDLIKKRFRVPVEFIDIPNEV